MSFHELTRARELLAGARLKCAERTRERDDALALLERHAYPAELGRAVDGLIEQVLRLRRRDDFPREFDFRSVVTGLAEEVEELREAEPGTDHEAEELRDVLTLVLHAIVARGGSLPREVGLAEQKLRGRLDAMDGGMTWQEAKDAEKAGRMAETFTLKVEHDGDDWRSWTTLTIDGPGAEAWFGVPKGMDPKLFEARLSTAVHVLNGRALTVQVMAAEAIAEQEAAIERHHDFCWELWGKEEGKRQDMVSELAAALGAGPSYASESAWPRMVAETKRLASGGGAYVVRTSYQGTWGYISGNGDHTIERTEAEVFGNRGQAEAARVEFVERVAEIDLMSWVEQVEDLAEFRGREDT